MYSEYKVMKSLVAIKSKMETVKSWKLTDQNWLMVSFFSLAVIFVRWFNAVVPYNIQPQLIVATGGDHPTRRQRSFGVGDSALGKATPKWTIDRHLIHRTLEKQVNLVTVLFWIALDCCDGWWLSTLPTQSDGFFLHSKYTPTKIPGKYQMFLHEGRSENS